ncbi:MAG: S16 family serine protease, partial [Vicinamibacteria bacterium]
ALLEVLDPEQNFGFNDHYLDLDYDLSRVMFITTANMLDPIPAPLRDRMEIIRIEGYTHDEKAQIAHDWLNRRQLEEHGLTQEHLVITGRAYDKMIAEYTKEAGVRNLERKIGAICRKVARRVAEGDFAKVTVTGANLHRFLGPPAHLPDEANEEDEIGVSTGLAWTQAGGEVLRIEATTMRGKGDLILTGQLGEVMKESAQAALSFARSVARIYGIAGDFYEKTQVHIHVPAGSIPKDGPSAGVAMACALVSILAKIPVSRKVAMTGEITLRGKVLPIGGLKDKTLAALRQGIDTICVPEGNRKDLEEIPPKIRKRIRFHFVRSMWEILEVSLLDPEDRAGRWLTTSSPVSSAPSPANLVVAPRS